MNRVDRIAVKKAKNVFSSYFRPFALKNDLKEYGVSNMWYGGYEILASEGVDWHHDGHFGYQYSYIYTIQNPDNNFHLEIATVDDIETVPPVSTRKVLMDVGSIIRLPMRRIHALFPKKELAFEKHRDINALWLGVALNGNSLITYSEARKKIIRHIINYSK